MAIAFVSTSTVVTGSAATLNVTMPGSLVSGNTLIVTVAHTGTMDAPPAGWSAGPDGNGVALFYKVSNGSETTTTFGATGATVTVGSTQQWSGVTTAGNPIGSSQTGTVSASIPSPSLSLASVNQDDMIVLSDTLNAARIQTPPSGYTAVFATLNRRAGVHYLIQATTGSTGTVQANSDSAGIHSAVLFSLTKAAGAFTCDASLANTATLASTATLGKVADSALAITATLAGAIAGGFVVNASLPVTATLSSTASRNAATDASLPITATLTATGTKGRPADASLAVTTTLSATASVTKGADASLPVTATLTSTATRNQFAAASRTVTATLTATATVGKVVNASLAVTATLASTASVSTANTGDAALPVTATLTSTATRGRSGAADIPVFATLVATGTTGKTADAELAAIATFAATASRVAVVDANLPITATLTATADVDSFLPVPRHAYARITSQTGSASIAPNDIEAVLT